MPVVDLPSDQLRAYAGGAAIPADFSEFWDATIAEARAHPLDVRFEGVETLLPLIDTFDVTFAGFGGQPIKAWLHLPAGWDAQTLTHDAARRLPRDAPPSTHDAARRLPAVVTYLGYSGGRGLPHQNTLWAQAGYAMLIMDSRGQGYGGQLGHTPDPHPSSGGNQYPGVMTRGLLSREDYYYRRIYTDALRAIEAVPAHPAVDAARVVVQGVSQGGGLALAAAGLAAGRLDGVVGCLPDVPFLCDYPRALEVASTGPYPELERYLVRHRDHVEAALMTLPYFDAVNHARFARVPAYFSVALRDTTCPPSTVYAAFNRYGEEAARAGHAASSGESVEKSIEEYQFNNHEGGGEHHVARQLVWLRKRLV
ncbi:acetylxylan esterase [Sinomonas sp. P10A9]|uniref:Acetylxylan esterase n=1 Tax=Sinomonas puerhi TaxID=3238584 RepID=A0AB39L287_9MICC